jgi:excisionase family DNA binding protein
MSARLEPLLTPTQVAELLAVKVATVRVYAERGSLPCVRIGGRLRFRPSDVHLWIEQRHSKGAK